MADFGAAAPSDEARQIAQWSVSTGDHQGMPFAVVDKKQARVYVFNGDGKLAGDTPALLGESVGDQSAPDVGDHTQSGFVPLEERTTPAGRFVSEPGQNLSGEHVVWVDYSAAFAIHRLRPGASMKAREARLASPSPADKRVSLGCVIVPPPFYEQVVQRVLGRTRAVVYVLPETTPVREVFAAM
ncbi:L,D-transpeptidase [Caenimonas sp. DR4.4]|uniref:L,D-transpeptidase n=1 Tax=Caenimonas aquaedulcis TaxID=2793270 RepID=A0A931H3C6_9BURK|nr:L,D-transpeptidase [Caenimonas aquaedulcis]